MDTLHPDGRDANVMRAVCLDGPRQARLVAVPEPVPGPGEVLVRVHACGVCASDLNAWRGVPGIAYPLAPGAPGHEVWGEVAALGSQIAGLRIGQPVSGLMWNGFAELGVARAEHLAPLPAAWSEPFLGEPLACALRVAQRARLHADQALAIVGFGYLAALVVQVLPARPSRWIALSRRPDSRALARTLGAEATFDFGEVPDALWDAFPVVIEAAGVQQALDYATWLVGYGGRLVIAGYHADGPRTVNLQTWNWKGIDVINAHDRDPRVSIQALHEGIALVQQRHLRLDALISHVWPLDRIAEAFAMAEARPAGYIKGLVQP